uniref:Uncharacterized protein n=1 Tax=Meloidogyne enterolobii TaxID=390850 RepID=A0A6V7TSC8_MELEN|nr:unnamed protein product [Meloidogyne enterolobii]
MSSSNSSGVNRDNLRIGPSSSNASGFSSLLAQRQRFDSVNNTNLSQSQQLQQQLSSSTSHFQANAGPSYPFGATAYASDYHAIHLIRLLNITPTSTKPTTTTTTIITITPIFLS